MVRNSSYIYLQMASVKKKNKLRRKQKASEGAYHEISIIWEEEPYMPSTIQSAHSPYGRSLLKEF